MNPVVSSRPSVIAPKEYVGAVMELCNERRGKFSAMEYLSEARVHLTYELPLGDGATGIISQLARGWQLNGIVSLSSGVPVNLELGFNRARNAQVTGTGFQQRPDLIAGSNNNPTDLVSTNDAPPLGSCPSVSIGSGILGTK